MRPHALLLLLVLASRSVTVPNHASAQSVGSSDRPVARGWEFDAWVGAGISVVVRPLGGVPNRQLLLGGVSAAHPLSAGHRVALSYFAEWLPVAVSTRTPRSEGVWLYSWGRFDSLFAPGSDRRGPVPGMGLVPLGLRGSATLGHVAAFAEVAGGAVAFTSKVPDPECRRLNFLAIAGLGVRLSRRPGAAPVVGYRFVHLSNAHTARRNPGLNAHLAYVGVAAR